MLNKSGRRASRFLHAKRCGDRIYARSLVEKLPSWKKVPYDSQFFCGGYALLAAQRSLATKRRSGSISTELGLSDHVRSTPVSDRIADIAGGPVGADIVAKVFLGRGTEIFRAADTSRAPRCEGPYRFTPKRPPTFVSALRSLAATEMSQNGLSRDFLHRRIFDFCNKICHNRKCAAIRSPRQPARARSRGQRYRAPSRFSD